MNNNVYNLGSGKPSISEYQEFLSEMSTFLAESIARIETVKKNPDNFEVETEFADLHTGKTFPGTMSIGISTLPKKVLADYKDRLKRINAFLKNSKPNTNTTSSDLQQEWGDTLMPEIKKLMLFSRKTLIGSLSPLKSATGHGSGLESQELQVMKQKHDTLLDECIGLFEREERLVAREQGVLAEPTPYTIVSYRTEPPSSVLRPS